MKTFSQTTFVEADILGEILQIISTVTAFFIIAFVLTQLRDRNYSWVLGIATVTHTEYFIFRRIRSLRYVSGSFRKSCLVNSQLALCEFRASKVLSQATNYEDPKY